MRRIKKLRGSLTLLAVTAATIGACLVPSVASASGCRYISPGAGTMHSPTTALSGPFGGVLRAEVCVNRPARPSVVWISFTP